MELTSQRGPHFILNSIDFGRLYRTHKLVNDVTEMFGS